MRGFHLIEQDIAEDGGVLGARLVGGLGGPAWFVTRRKAQHGMRARVRQLSAVVAAGGFTGEHPETDFVQVTVVPA